MVLLNILGLLVRLIVAPSSRFLRSQRTGAEPVPCGQTGGNLRVGLWRPRAVGRSRDLGAASFGIAPGREPDARKDERILPTHLVSLPQGLGRHARLETTGQAHACRLGFEGIVSKRRDAPYRSGRSGTWLKVKNREHPAMSRDWEDRFS